ncbi:MAG: hypothetical protein N3A58_04955 [Spirochaetes bacterium]|nr:hypothetical protein [Spirochaetota bacterium]
MRIKIYLLKILLLSIIIFNSIVGFENYEVIEESKNGNINWTYKYYESTGAAYFDKNILNFASNELITTQKAIEEGFKNLFNLIVYQIYDSRYNILDLIKIDPDLQININKYVHYSKKSNIISKDDYRAVNFQLPFLLKDYSIYEALNLKRDYFVQIRNKSSFIHTTKFTGLVIDARGYNLKPSLKSKLLNEDREVFFSFDNVKWNFITKFGYITYIYDHKALKNFIELIGENPFFISALDSYGINNTDLILSNKSIEMLIGNPENLNIFYESRIIIIIDKIKN